MALHNSGALALTLFMSPGYYLRLGLRVRVKGQHELGFRVNPNTGYCALRFGLTSGGLTLYMLPRFCLRLQVKDELTRLQMALHNSGALAVMTKLREGYCLDADEMFSLLAAASSTRQCLRYI